MYVNFNKNQFLLFSNKHIQNFNSFSEVVLKLHLKNYHYIRVWDTVQLLEKAEMPGILESPVLFMILTVYYRITDDTGKLTEKMEFNESLTSA